MRTAANQNVRRTAALLGRWPSLADLARDIGASYWTVYSWAKRGRIPDVWWDAIIGSAVRYQLDRVVTYESLARTAAPLPRKRRQIMKGMDRVGELAA